MLNFAKRIDVRWYVCLAALALIGLVVFLAIPSKVSSAQALEAEEVQDASITAGEGNSLARASEDLANVGRELFPSNRQREATVPGAEKALTGLSVSPEAIYFDGPKGGPFRQSEGSFRVKNTSLATINWSVDDDGANLWAIISSTASGALSSGESLEVVVQLDAGEAAAFAGGSYTANLIVHNNDTGETASMPVNLFVADPLLSTTHPNPNLWFANTTLAVSWSGTFHPESNRFAWKVDDQPDSAITDDNIADPSVHQTRDVRQIEWPGNEHGTHYFHIVAIDTRSSGVIDGSLRHYQFNVIAEPPTVESSSHRYDLSMERDFVATPTEYETKIDPTSAQWTQVMPSGSMWSGRYEHTTAVLDNKLWVLGGLDRSFRNDVWSSLDGAHWTQVTSSGAIWSGRRGHTTAVLDNKLWVLGGWDGSFRNDVWSSADGAHWTQVTPSGSIWSGRSWHTTAVFDNKLWVLGGWDGSFRNDVWSSLDGAHWTQVTPSAEWPERRAHTTAVFQGKLWVLGGADGAYNYRNDVWSSADGAHWTEVTPSGSIWSARHLHTTAVFASRLWVLGGHDKPLNERDDVWCSPDGAHWTRVTLSGSMWSARESHATAVFDNKLWVIGGYEWLRRLNDVWFLAGPVPLSESNFSQYFYAIDDFPDTVVTEENAAPWTDDLPIVVPDQKPGEHYFHVAAQDLLGNPTPTGHYHFTVGDAVPVVSSSSHASPSTKKNVVLSWTDGGLPSGMLDCWYYEFDDKPTTPVTTSSTPTKNPGETFTCKKPRDYYLHIATYDTYKNLSSAAHFYTRVLQSAAPAPYSDPPRLQTKSYGCRNITFKWNDPETVDPAVNGYRYVFDEQPGTDPGNPESGDTTSVKQWSVQNVSLGTHYFHVVGQDACDMYSAPGHFRVNIRKAHAPVVKLELNSTAQLLHFTWTDPENPPFAACYLVACDRNPRTTPTTELCQTFYNQFDVTESPTPWYLHLIAEDGNSPKNLSDPVHYAVMVWNGMSLAISNPSKEYTKGGEDIVYDVIYAGARSISLDCGDITVHTSDTATATVSCNIAANGNIRTITFPGANISGNGTVYFSLAAGTATGPSGPAPAMDSPPFVVDNIKPQITIGEPSTSCASGGPVEWMVTYSDTGGLDWASLSADGITPVPSGSVIVDAWNVEAVDATTFVVTAKGIQGKGTLGFSISAGTAADFAGNMADGKISLTCNVDTTPPVASNQTVSLHMTTSKNVDITAVDTDDTTLTYVIVSQPTHGELTGIAPALTYTPQPYFVGTDQFTFTASDGCYTTAPATVTLNVTNTPPVAEGQAVSLHMNTSKAITVRATDADGDDPLFYTRLSGPTHGKLEGPLPNATYTPDDCYVGADEFQFRASDGQANSNTAIVSITVTNTAPVVEDQAVSLHMCASKAIVVPQTDAEGDLLTYTVVSVPAHGTLTGALPNLTYTAECCYAGQDQITFRANDCAADSNIGTIAITVTNTPPVAQDKSVTLHMRTTKPSAVEITVSASDADNDSPLAYTLVTGPSHGALTGPLPTVTYTPEQCFAGTDEFTFKANDCQADSNTATVSITVSNAAPVAQDKSVTLHMRTTTPSSVAITVTASDAENDSLDYTLVSEPTHGGLSGTPPNVTYTPENCYVGQDSFTFKAKDCAADSNTATVAITVSNTAPVAQDQIVSLHMCTSKVVVVAATDGDADPLTYALVSGPAHGTLSGILPNVTYTPADCCYVGQDQIAFRADDCAAYSNLATITISVTNTAPAADDQTVQVCIKEPQAVVLTGADADSDPLSFAVVGQPEHGALEGTPPDLTYTPDTGFVGADSFTFTAGDCQATSNVATVSLDVISVGSVTVTIEPEYARTHGAQWSVDGGDPHSSGETVGDLDSGEHVISFTGIPAYDPGGCNPKTTYLTPPDQQVTITACADAPATATYEVATKNLPAQVPSGGQGGNLLLLGSAAAALGFVPYSRSAKARTRRK